MFRRRLGRGAVRGLGRRWLLGAAAGALVVPLSGCVTVHGERALVPSVRPAEAAKVLARFADRNNEATKAYDEQAVASVESGPLGAIDRAGVHAKHLDTPGGDKDFTPLRFSDTSYLVPKQRGWPKFFVADTRSNRSGDARWLLVFRRDSPATPWMADFLGVAEPAQVPRFAKDKDGYAVAVPNAGSGLTVDPGRLSAAYAAYLDGASGGPSFAPGPSTSQLRQTHAKEQRTADTVTQYADQGDSSGDFTPVALRTADGGAVVFFGSRHQSRATFRAGYRLDLDKDTQALTQGTPKTSITLSRVAQQMALVPAGGTKGPGGTDGKGGGQVTVVSRLVGLVGAKGA
jgi:hypothetical protein